MIKSVLEFFRTKGSRRSLLKSSNAPGPVTAAASANLPESVHFYTFHKCASTLFSSYVLKNLEGLKHVNYASKIYSGKGIKELVFKERGYVYGPHRITSGPVALPFKVLDETTTALDFIRDKNAVFFIRDPRDILVSSYYSFGFAHGLSPVEVLRERQQDARSQIQAVSIDEYVLASAKTVARNFEIMGELASACEKSVILRYEDMINNFDHFITQLSKWIVITPDVVQEIHLRSRPKAKENTSSHQRSGQVGGFRGKLKEETIEALAKELEPALVRFQYET